MDEDTAVDLLRRVPQPYGVAFHVGSQMLTPDAWAKPLAAVGRIMERLGDTRLGLLDLGGGFPAHYDTPPPPLARYAEVITEGLAALPYPVPAVIEPGRALVAEAGTLHATVIGVATRHGQAWAHLDVGAFNGLMEALETGNRLGYPVTDSRGDPRRVAYHLTGPTCDSQDTIRYDVPLSAGLRTGDRVRIGGTGAYTTVYASTFNGFAGPTVVCDNTPSGKDPAFAGTVTID